LCSLCLAELLAVFRRHLAIVEHLGDLLPRLRIAPHFGERCKTLKVKFAFRLVGRMAVQTELFEDRMDLLAVWFLEIVERGVFIGNCRYGNEQAREEYGADRSRVKTRVFSSI
jgi:hypothetical protein